MCASEDFFLSTLSLHYAESAASQNLMHVALPVTVSDDAAKDFFLKGMKGFVLDDLSTVLSRDGSDAAKLRQFLISIT